MEGQTFFDFQPSSPCCLHPGEEQTDQTAHAQTNGRTDRGVSDSVGYRTKKEGKEREKERGGRRDGGEAIRRNAIYGVMVCRWHAGTLKSVPNRSLKLLQHHRFRMGLPGGKPKSDCHVTVTITTVVHWGSTGNPSQPGDYSRRQHSFKVLIAL